MAGESQVTPEGTPDPSVLTTEQMLRENTNQEKLFTAIRDGDRALANERLAAIKRETELRESHRQELKSDSEKALTTALTAAEKAVQAALAAAEKARDQQTIASQLATTKAENAFVEQLSQQGATFTLAISNVTSGLNDMKSLMGELRAERRGAFDNIASQRLNIGAMVGVGTLLVGLLSLAATIIIVLTR